MTEPTDPALSDNTLPDNALAADGVSDRTLPDDRRGNPPPPGSAWVEDHEPPASEAERQAFETVRSVSRLDESN